MTFFLPAKLSKGGLVKVKFGTFVDEELDPLEVVDLSDSVQYADAFEVSLLPSGDDTEVAEDFLAKLVHQVQRYVKFGARNECELFHRK